MTKLEKALAVAERKVQEGEALRRKLHNTIQVRRRRCCWAPCPALPCSCMRTQVANGLLSLPPLPHLHAAKQRPQTCTSGLLPAHIGAGAQRQHPGVLPRAPAQRQRGRGGAAGPTGAVLPYWRWDMVAQTTAAHVLPASNALLEQLLLAAGTKRKNCCVDVERWGLPAAAAAGELAGCGLELATAGSGGKEVQQYSFSFDKVFSPAASQVGWRALVHSCYCHASSCAWQGRCMVAHRPSKVFHRGRC